jgi:predicted GH43/DUF377 family glycosyl hydrolase
MRWIKKGLIYAPNKRNWWSYYYGILPTPLYLKKENKIRIYFATSDKERYSRITYIDVDADNPSKILYKHKSFVLDVGEIGQFDDCGVNPSSIVRIGKKIYLYYVGYQRCQRTPYMLFPGLAVSDDSGESFHKYSKAPIIDRSKDYSVSHAAPFVIRDRKNFRMWLWLGMKWVAINSKLYISAKIGYAESKNGLNWDIKQIVIKPNEKKEFSLGRPWVIHENGMYKMWYSVRYVDKLYRIGYAESKDGLKWNRKDKEAGIDVSKTGWDSEMICYPAIIKVKKNTYMFYNGNKNGETGFGYAILENDKKY